MITLIRPNGSTAVGRPDGGLIPVDIDYGAPYDKVPALLGAISVAANSRNVIGSGGADFTQLKSGDFLNLSPNIPPSQIESITGSGAMTIKEPITTAITNGIYKRALQMYMGLTLEAKMEESIGYAEFKASQRGNQAYKKLLNSYMLTVSAKLVEPVAERTAKVIPGFFINYDQTTGNIKGAARTVPMWKEYMWNDLASGRGQQLELTALIAPEVRSLDPMDKIIIPNALCYTEFKQGMDGEVGAVLEIKWECFVSKDLLFAGYPLAWYMGDLDVT
ncbi:hypothetical protein LEP1GSC161_0330 [Leptospira santarosai str. CBC1416]|uniref:Uncharacterized protein n=2 Tax=Leptospira santarosai TaxID=28183 RepID=M6ULU7_9LEPT|nr:hypothetical protein [Leptospira santarosai]EMO43791.1 hypothetical protein LEP1GSC187_0523 [Leptospira santarosai str. ZUN179]EMO57783.1 hypothetical protein LEP1GSC161_0330 [Leptospira santarosai str. CBC1416]